MCWPSACVRSTRRELRKARSPLQPSNKTKQRTLFSVIKFLLTIIWRNLQFSLIFFIHSINNTQSNAWTGSRSSNHSAWSACYIQSQDRSISLQTARGVLPVHGRCQATTAGRVPHPLLFHLPPTNFASCQLSDLPYNSMLM